MATPKATRLSPLFPSREKLELMVSNWVPHFKFLTPAPVCVHANIIATVAVAATAVGKICRKSSNYFYISLFHTNDSDDGKDKDKWLTEWGVDLIKGKHGRKAGRKQPWTALKSQKIQFLLKTCGMQ